MKVDRVGTCRRGCCRSSRAAAPTTGWRGSPQAERVIPVWLPLMSRLIHVAGEGEAVRHRPRPSSSRAVLAARGLRSIVPSAVPSVPAARVAVLKKTCASGPDPARVESGTNRSSRSRRSSLRVVQIACVVSVSLGVPGSRRRSSRRSGVRLRSGPSYGAVERTAVGDRRAAQEAPPPTTLVPAGQATGSSPAVFGVEGAAGHPGTAADRPPTPRARASSVARAQANPMFPDGEALRRSEPGAESSAASMR